MPKFTVDGQTFEASSDKNLLEVLLARGIDLPYFCWHPEMGSIGACRQCAVVQYRDEDDTQGRLVMSCMTPIADGARFSVDADNAKTFRRSVVEGLMINHPHDCPVCEEGGECHLQDMTVMTGHRDRVYRGKKTTFRNQYLGPLVGHEMNRCITCYRCVRFYQEYAGGDDLGAFASRDHVYFGRSEDGVLGSEFAGNLIEVCPTGVFTDKRLAEHYTRKWDLQSAPSVCTGCSLGCNTTPAERYGELRRIHNRYNHRINGYFLCDRGRFAGGFVNSEDRVPYVGMRREDGVFEVTEPAKGISLAADWIGGANRVVGIGSTRATLEANFLLGQLVGTDNLYVGLTESQRRLTKLISDTLTTTRAKLPSTMEAEDYDAILVLGEDLTNHAPRLALAVRQALRLVSRERAASAEIPPWHDAAVRKIGGDDASPLIVVTPYADRLDEVARRSIRLSPEGIAELGFDIAEALAHDSATGRAGEIAAVLREAKRPLVISGSSFASDGIVKAAANIANGLAAANDETGLILCPDHCNSIGSVRLPHKSAGIESLAAGDDIDVAVVLENDLAQLTPDVFNAVMGKIGRLIVLDALDNRVSSAAHLVFPAATFAEGPGTYVNNEGTAQRAYAVFHPADPIAPSWHWLAQLGSAVSAEGFEQAVSLDAVIKWCDRAVEGFDGLERAAPNADFRISGARVPRMPYRYSGRTAMNAHISVHEPKPPADSDSPLSHSMEGTMKAPPGALQSFAWYPGWNSNQSISKFQEEIAGPLRAGDAGARVIPVQEAEPTRHERPAAAALSESHLPVVPRHHIFGSDPFAGYTKQLAQLTPNPTCLVHPALAESLGVAAGEGLEVTVDGESRAFEVVIDENAAEDCVMVSAGWPETADLVGVTSLAFSKAENFTPPAKDDVITTDRKR